MVAGYRENTITVSTVHGDIAPTHMGGSAIVAAEGTPASGTSPAPRLHPQEGVVGTESQSSVLSLPANPHTPRPAAPRLETRGATPVQSPPRMGIGIQTEPAVLPDRIIDALATWIRTERPEPFATDPQTLRHLIERIERCWREHHVLVVADFSPEPIHVCDNLRGVLLAHGIHVADLNPFTPANMPMLPYTAYSPTTTALKPFMNSPWHMISFWQNMADGVLERTALDRVKTHRLVNAEALAGLVQQWTTGASESLIKSFTIWLGFLCETAEYAPPCSPPWDEEAEELWATRVTQYQHAYAQRVLAVLQQGAAHPPLRDHVLHMVDLNLSDCGDKRGIELDIVEIACLTEEARIGGDACELARICIGAWRYDLLFSIARREAEKLPVTPYGTREDVELALFFICSLRPILGLPGYTSSMLFARPTIPETFKRTDYLSQIVSEIMTASSSQSQLHTILACSDAWQQFLRIQHPDSFASCMTTAHKHLAILDMAKERSSSARNAAFADGHFGPYTLPGLLGGMLIYALPERERRTAVQEKAYQHAVALAAAMQRNPANVPPRLALCDADYTILVDGVNAQRRATEAAIVDALTREYMGRIGVSDLRPELTRLKQA